MSHLLYVRNLPNDTDLLRLIIYFQSGESGGGDINEEDSQLEDGVAVLDFESKEDLENVLRQKHEIDGCKIEISDKPFKLSTQKRSTNKPSMSNNSIPDKEKAYLDEVRTVIVSGLNIDTTDETLHMFFENARRSGGGKIEHLERCDSDVAHLTFAKAEVAAEVLKREKLELDGYLLQLKEKQPKLHLPPDKKKLYIENINPKTTKDSVSNYIELQTDECVCELWFGDSQNAIVLFENTVDLEKVIKKKKPLEGAELKISHPPLCNTLLITGLTQKTTKQAIEMYFESEKYGGGKIYGEVIHQKERGVAVVSFCDPDVLTSLLSKELLINGAKLGVCQHYQFMREIKEVVYKKISVDRFVLNHVNRKCQLEFSDHLGTELLQRINENNGELTLPEEMANACKLYFDRFVVLELPFSEKLFQKSEDELRKLCGLPEVKNDVTAIMDKSMVRVVVGKEKEKYARQMFQDALSKMEESLNIVSTETTVPKNKLELLSLHGFDAFFGKKCQADVCIVKRTGLISIKGTEKQVQQAKTLILEKCSHITEDSIQIKEAQKRFLESGNLDAINCRMRDAGMKGIILFNEESIGNKMKVLVFNGTKVKNVETFLNDNVYEKVFRLEDESVDLLQTNLWQDFKTKALRNTPFSIDIIEKGLDNISVIGERRKVEETCEAVQVFMDENTIVSDEMNVGAGLSRFLNEYHGKELENICHIFMNASLKIESKDGIIKIKGTNYGVQEATKSINNILSKVASDKVSFVEARARQYFHSQEGKVFLTGMESRHNCVIHVSEDSTGASDISNTIPPISSSVITPSSRYLGDYETGEKIKLRLFLGDITRHQCDVIVNAANGDLKHAGGVAKCILDAAGNEVQDECDAYVEAAGPLYEGECFVGKPGKLHFKCIIHAVAPKWNDRNHEKTRRILHVTCTKVLFEAKEFQTIAIPALGSGVFGVPKEVCAEVMIEAAKEFSSTHGDSKLKEIHFVNNDKASFDAFQRQFDSKFGSGSSVKTNFLSRPIPRKRHVEINSNSSFGKIAPIVSKSSLDEVIRERKPADHILEGNIKIYIVVGDLSKHRADILVNTTGQTLQLSSNHCSRSLSAVAGPELQNECNRIGPLKLYEVKVTAGGNLQCDSVYHVLCVKWNNGEGEKVLRSIIQQCLSTACANGKQSIAFPAIGTGVLDFPHKEAARIFFEVTKSFARQNSNCSLKEVAFVLFRKDLKIIEAFQNELKQPKEWNDSSESEDGDSSGFQQRFNRNFNSSQNDKSIVVCLEVCDNKVIEIVKGDITKESSDVIAHVTNSNLVMRSGVARSLSQVGGREIKRACKSALNSSPPLASSTVLTSAGNLRAKYIAHMVARNNPSLNEIESCLKDFFDTISKMGLQSVSLPAVGTGSLNHDPEKAALTLLKSIIRSQQSNPGSPNKVRVVLKDDELVEVFQKAVKTISECGDLSLWKKITNLFSGSSVPRITVQPKSQNDARIDLSIYAKDDESLKMTITGISNVIKSQKKKDNFQDESIKNLSTSQIKDLQDLFVANNIQATIEVKLDRILMYGHPDDVFKVKNEIFQFLRELDKVEKEKKRVEFDQGLANIVSQCIQWYYVNPKTGAPEEYDPGTNAIIEKAYSKKEKSVEFRFKKQDCEIDFDAMLEKTSTHKLKIIRKDLKAETALPDYWDPQPRDANGKEHVFHLVALDQQNPRHQKEYNEVSADFLKTARRNIISIQRVQNPTLYKQYLLKKKSLDAKNGSCEKWLFHGTAGNNLQKINESGLNRSFAGNSHGAAHGRGVYFATDASMSAGYAQPYGSTGSRYMYRTKVAVGKFTRSNPSFVVPPDISPGNAYDSVVDNLANPKIYVLFYDHQYYPEYLITFT